MIGLNPLEAQRLAQKQMNQPWYISQHNINAKGPSPAHHNYSLDDKAIDLSYDLGGAAGPTANRLGMLQQTHGHSLNIDAFNGINNNPNMMHRNNAKRNTLRRARRIADGSVEDFSGGAGDLTPQQIMLMRSQQYLNSNSAGKEGSVTAGPFGQKNPSSKTQHGQHAATIFYPSELITTSHLPRRKSLPSIIKSFKEDATAHSSSDLNAARIQETFIIENGIRKRVTERLNSNMVESDEADSLKRYLSSEYNDDQTPQLPHKIIIESIGSLNSTAKHAKRSSLPCIPAYLNSRFAHKGRIQNFRKIYKKVYNYLIRTKNDN